MGRWRPDVDCTERTERELERRNVISTAWPLLVGRIESVGVANGKQRNASGNVVLNGCDRFRGLTARVTRRAVSWRVSGADIATSGHDREHEEARRESCRSGSGGQGRRGRFHGVACSRRTVGWHGVSGAQRYHRLRFAAVWLQSTVGRKGSICWLDGPSVTVSVHDPLQTSVALEYK